MIQESIAALVEGKSLTREQAAEAMNALMSGEATPSQIGAFLVALRIKGETIEEIAGLAQVMRAKADRVPLAVEVIDTCGTGGDGHGTMNVSTAAAFVAAGAGLKVAKHGNRGMTSRSGSADVLEALGFNIDLGPDQVSRCIEEGSFGFMFAQRFHPAMKHVGPTRKEIGVRTVFNILGPLTNPAHAAYQVIGVPDPKIAAKMAEALRLLGSKRAIVLTGAQGLDEIGLHGPTTLHFVSPEGVTTQTVAPEDLGIPSAPISAIAGGTPAENAVMIREIFGGARGPRRDVVVLNAAAALVAGGCADNLKDAVGIANEVIESGSAALAMDKAARLSQSV